MAALHRRPEGRDGIPHAVACRALGVSRSWFYKHKDCHAAAAGARRERLTAEVTRLFAAHQSKYGSPLITADLPDAGWRVSKNTVAALMAEQDLAARREPPAQGHYPSRTGRWRAPDLVQPRLPGHAGSTTSGTAMAPRSPPAKASSISPPSWTWLPAGSSGSPSPSTTTRRGLRRAGHGRHCARRAGPRRDHAHRSGQRIHRPASSTRPAAGFVSPSRWAGPGSALDNAVIESWHSTLEFELRSLEHFATRAAARARVSAWIEDYNHHRRHSALPDDVASGLRESAPGRGGSLTCPRFSATQYRPVLAPVQVVPPRPHGPAGADTSTLLVRVSPGERFGRLSFEDLMETASPGTALEA